jgi:hypothetical protein
VQLSFSLIRISSFLQGRAKPIFKGLGFLAISQFPKANINIQVLRVTKLLFPGKIGKNQG